MKDRHPVEVLLNASADDILSAVQRGFRALVDVKGKLAEFFLERQLTELAKSGVITSFEWKDADGEPDFILKVRGRDVILECKNIRSRELFRQPAPGYKVELQKTRNSKDETPTRGYRIDDFDVLAVCLFNHTGKWEYLFIDTASLETRPDMAEFLKLMQRVPFGPDERWTASLADVLSRVTSK